MGLPRSPGPISANERCGRSIATRGSTARRADRPPGRPSRSRAPRPRARAAHSPRLARARARAWARRRPPRSRAGGRATAAPPGESARALGGAVNQARSQSGSSGASIRRGVLVLEHPEHERERSPGREHLGQRLDAARRPRRGCGRRRAPSAGPVEQLQAARAPAPTAAASATASLAERACPRRAGRPRRRRVRARSCAAGRSPARAAATGALLGSARTSPRVALAGDALGDRERRLGRGRRRARASSRGATTASFSSAMSLIVGPSQRVCSRPTFVSTVTRASITLVAS